MFKTLRLKCLRPSNWRWSYTILEVMVGPNKVSQNCLFGVGIAYTYINTCSTHLLSDVKLFNTHSFMVTLLDLVLWT